MENLFLRPVRIFLMILLVGFGMSGFAQPPADTLTLTDSVQDTILPPVDTVSIAPVKKKDTVIIRLQHPFASDSFLFRNRLFFNFTNPVRYTISERNWQGKEIVFYTIVALLILFAIIKNAFRRYLSDLFSSYFRTTVRQRQIKEQLLQSPLPSMFFNVFFIFSTAIFVALLFQHFGLGNEAPFWMLAAYCAAGLIVIYAGKYLALKFFGWVFQLSEVTETYIFVVFSTNKILGVLLLPLTIVLAFGLGMVGATAATLGLVVIGGLFAYRYFLSYVSVNHLISINIFHFLLYLAAFEVLPLLLINKLLFTYLREIS